MNTNVLEQIISDVKTHILEYLVLLTTALFFVVLLSVFKGEHTKQFIVVILFTLYYVMWGIIHHSRNQTLNIKIVLEYIFIGVLALLLLQSLLIN